MRMMSPRRGKLCLSVTQNARIRDPGLCHLAQFRAKMQRYAQIVLDSETRSNGFSMKKRNFKTHASG